MRKVWKISITRKLRHCIDLHINQIETETIKDQEDHYSQCGAFDPVVHSILRLEDIDDMYKVISNLYKKKFTFTSEAKSIFEPYFYQAKHHRPDFFI